MNSNPTFAAFAENGERIENRRIYYSVIATVLFAGAGILASESHQSASLANGSEHSGASIKATAQPLVRVARPSRVSVATVTGQPRSSVYMDLFWSRDPIPASKPLAAHASMFFEDGRHNRLSPDSLGAAIRHYGRSDPSLDRASLPMRRSRSISTAALSADPGVSEAAEMAVVLPPKAPVDVSPAAAVAEQPSVRSAETPAIRGVGPDLRPAESQEPQGSGAVQASSELLADAVDNRRGATRDRADAAVEDSAALVDGLTINADTRYAERPDSLDAADGDPRIEVAEHADRIVEGIAHAIDDPRSDSSESYAETSDSLAAADGDAKVDISIRSDRKPGRLSDADDASRRDAGEPYAEGPDSLVAADYDARGARVEHSGEATRTVAVLEPDDGLSAPKRSNDPKLTAASVYPASPALPTSISAPKQISSGIEFEVSTRINGVDVGKLSLLIEGASVGHPEIVQAGISVRLADLVSLLSSRMDRKTMEALRASAAAQQYITFDELRSHGIAVSFDHHDRLLIKAA